MILVHGKRKCEHVVVSLAVKRWTEGCYNVTMPLKASKDTKLQRETQRTKSVLGTSWKLTPMYFARVVFPLFFFLSLSLFFWFVPPSFFYVFSISSPHFIQYTAEVIPHFINNAAPCFYIVQPKWFSAECFRGEWIKREKKNKRERKCKKTPRYKSTCVCNFFQTIPYSLRVYLLWLCCALKALNINNMYFELI